MIARTPLVPTRAVHMTAISWETDYLREPVLEMLRKGLINSIELDLKDESGIVGYDSKVPLANEIGAVQPSYDLREAVDADPLAGRPGDRARRGVPRPGARAIGVGPRRARSR